MLVLFGIGPVVGMIASAIYAIPFMVKNTILGLERVPSDIAEAGVMSGCTPRQHEPVLPPENDRAGRDHERRADPRRAIRQLVEEEPAVDDREQQVHVVERRDRRRLGVAIGIRHQQLAEHAERADQHDE